MGGKYTRNYVANRSISREERTRIHPIWRGVGCAIIILFPIIGWLGSTLLLEANGENNWIPVPVDLVMPPSHFLYAALPDPMLYIKLILTITIVIALFAIFTFVSFLLSNQFGYTNKRDPYYVPPVKSTRRRR